jgi:hypothetical protein
LERLSRIALADRPVGQRSASHIRPLNMAPPVADHAKVPLVGLDVLDRNVQAHESPGGVIEGDGVRTDGGLHEGMRDSLEASVPALGVDASTRTPPSPALSRHFWYATLKQIRTCAFKWPRAHSGGYGAFTR